MLTSCAPSTRFDVEPPTREEGPLGPLSFSATCQITEVIDEPHRFGFVYTTLPHHHDDGSELFLVELHADRSVSATIAAAWRPVSLATRLWLPLTRLVQRRYTRRYLDGIARQVLHAALDGSVARLGRAVWAS